MSLSSIANRFIVSSVSITEDIPSRINIKKRRETIVYRSVSDDDNINIAYLSGLDSSANNNLWVSDRSTSLIQNREPSSTDIITVTANSITLNVEEFLITDKFTTKTPTQPSVPLFYVHVLKNFNDSMSGVVDGSITLVNIEFADYELNTLELSEYILDSSTGEFFNNIENSFNQNTKQADITFIKYTVKTTSSGSSTIEVFHELVNNNPIFNLADFEDVDAFGVLYSDRDTYLIEETGGTFLVTLPRTSTYAYKELPESRIKALPPSLTDTFSPWYLRVTAGHFLTSLLATKTAYNTYEYKIAEFNNQTFDPYPPYKSQLDELATRVTSRLIQTSKNIASSTSSNLYTTVIIYDRADVIKYALTDNPGQIGLYFGSSAIVYADDILSIDMANGFIEVDAEILEEDKVYVTYYTEENQYEVTSIDCNPANNLNILNQHIVLYIAPETGAETLTKSLFYLIVDPLGRIQYCSQTEDNASGTDPGTIKLLAEDFTAEGLPRHEFYYNIVSSESSLASTTSGSLQSVIDGFSFIDKYTVESQLVNQLTTISGAAYSNFLVNPKFLVLADIHVGESQRSDAFTTFDVRVQGGGIKEAEFNNALDEQSDIVWYWDNIQLRPYPATTSSYVEIPQSLHQDHGGSFSRESIISAVEKHMQFGGYASIKFYGIEPTISSLTTSSGSFTINWPSYGSDTSYNVYYATTLDGPYYQLNATELTNNVVGNTYLVSGLNASTSYYVFVEGIDENDDWSYGPAVMATTTAYTE